MELLRTATLSNTVGETVWGLQLHESQMESKRDSYRIASACARRWGWLNNVTAGMLCSCSCNTATAASAEGTATADTTGGGLTNEKQGAMLRWNRRHDDAAETVMGSDEGGLKHESDARGVAKLAGARSTTHAQAAGSGASLNMSIEGPEAGTAKTQLSITEAALSPLELLASV